jgi:hypothetical protein
MEEVEFYERFSIQARIFIGQAIADAEKVTSLNKS